MTTTRNGASAGRSPSRLGSTQCDLLDHSDRRLHLELVGQLADLGFWVAAVTTEGLQEGQLAFLGPAGHGLGRHVQDIGDLGGPEVAGGGGCGYSAGLGCDGASLSCGRTRVLCRARSGAVSSSHRSRAWPVTMLAVTVFLGEG
jgi:hypothetical protein